MSKGGARKDTQVLVIGAGVVGLAASLFLHQQGIRCTVIERRPGTSVHPRARSVNARTMEMFRHLGIDQLVHDAGRKAGIANSKGIFTGTSMKEVIGPRPRATGKKTMPFANITGQISPAEGTFVTQDYLEPVLVEAAKDRGVEICFNTEFVSLEQDNEAVRTTVRDRATGAARTITASFAIAADGAKSPVCAHLGVKKTGRGAIGHMINVLFHADLADFVKDREFSLLKIRSPEVDGLFTSINNTDRWVFHLCYDPAKGEKVGDFSKERCAALVKKALGMPELDVSVESLLPWEPAVRVAERMQYGRVFIAGDAAHQMPPWAGQGASTGFADVHNLVWKVAAVLNGKAGEALLRTYDIERQPVDAYAAEASATGADDMGLTDLNIRRSEVRKGILMKAPIITGFGYGYESSQAICAESNWPLGGITWTPWTIPAVFLSLDGRPGRRVPHIWGEREGKQVSTVDMVVKDFAMLVSEDEESQWREAAAQVIKDLGIHINVNSVGSRGDLVAESRSWHTAAGITSRGALLVRPDDFVAARWRKGSSNHAVDLRSAVKQAMCLS